MVGPPCASVVAERAATRQGAGASRFLVDTRRVRALNGSGVPGPTLTLGRRRSRLTPRIALVAVALIALGFSARRVSSADQVVLGKVFLVANPDAGDPAKRRI